MTEKEAIEEAKRRYPVGTKVKLMEMNAGGKFGNIVKHTKYSFYNDGQLYVDSNLLLLSEGKWAEIVSLPEQEFKVGDWVCANGKNHTRNNPSFPEGIPFKIEGFSSSRDENNPYVDVDISSTSIQGTGTDTSSIRHCTVEELAKAELPERWCIKVINQDIVDYCNENGGYPPYQICNSFYAHFPHFGARETTTSKIQKGYTEINYEQFKKYVLKQDIMEQKIIGYKLKEEYKQYEKVAAQIATAQIATLEYNGDLLHFNKSLGYNFTRNSPVGKRIEAAGILDIWFESVYEQSKSLPKINGYDGQKISDDTVKYGCATFSVDSLKVIIETECTSSNRKIRSIILDSGVEITMDQIKQIVNYFK